MAKLIALVVELCRGGEAEAGAWGLLLVPHPPPPAPPILQAGAGCGPAALSASPGTHGAVVTPRSALMFSRSPEWGMSDSVSSETLTELICFLVEQK